VRAGIAWKTHKLRNYRAVVIQKLWLLAYCSGRAIRAGVVPLSPSIFANHLHLCIVAFMGRSMCNPGGLLRGAGLRRTSPRVSVLSYICNARYPFSIKELREKFPRIDLVTLYRMMGDFGKAGIVTRVELGSGRAMFELNDGKDHHHIVCTSCERIEDFSDTEHERLVGRVLKRSRAFSRLTGHSFELYGLCNSCVKSQ